MKLTESTMFDPQPLDPLGAELVQVLTSSGGKEEAQTETSQGGKNHKRLRAHRFFLFERRPVDRLARIAASQAEFHGRSAFDQEDGFFFPIVMACQFASHCTHPEMLAVLKNGVALYGFVAGAAKKGKESWRPSINIFWC